MLAACTEPKLFSGLVLLGASACYVNDPENAYTGGFTADGVKSLLAEMKNNYAAWANGFSPLMMGNPDQPDLAANFATSLKVLRPDIAVKVLGTALLTDIRSFAEQYRTLKLPTLFLQAMDDPAVPLSAATWLATATGSELHLLNVQGHFPHIVNPYLVATKINEFLERHEL